MSDIFSASFHFLLNWRRTFFLSRKKSYLQLCHDITINELIFFSLTKKNLLRPGLLTCS